jgi:GNAT superfamily N-acetyltransferase
MITNPSEKREITHTIKRLSATLRAPNIVMLIATLGNDGPFMGCASFLKAVPPPSNEHRMHIFRPSAFHQGHNFKSLMDWTDCEVDEMHSGLNTELLETIMVHQQQQREELMGNQPYIMLGPIWVLSEYRSRGVSSKLIYKGFDMSRDARVPLLLSGVFPNAKPAYLHLGFETLEGYDGLMMWWPEMIARGKVKGGRLVY